MSDSVYKIFRPFEWEQFQSALVFAGSVHDLRDGFIHLCTQEQLPSTADKYFLDQYEIIIAEFSASTLNFLKWEPARGGILFPHVYGTLDHAHLLTYETIAQQAGRFILSSSLRPLPLAPPETK